MKYMLLIHQGSTPTPNDPDAWNGCRTTSRPTTSIRTAPGRRPHPASTLAAKTRLLEVQEAVEDEVDDDTVFPDERLELVYMCCHPALAVDAAGGAHAADVRVKPHRRPRSPARSSSPRRRWPQRLVRAKRKIRRPASSSGCRPRDDRYLRMSRAVSCCDGGSASWPELRSRGAQGPRHARPPRRARRSGDASAKSCADVANPYPGTRYEGVDLTRITAAGVTCTTARRVARGAHRRALGLPVAAGRSGGSRGTAGT